jgi:uncharacterized protein HemX
MQPDIPDVSPAINQLSSSGDLGSVIVLLFFAIFLGVGWYIYISNKQLRLSEEDRKDSDRRQEIQAKEHESLLRELKDTLSRLADVQETTMDFIKDTVAHERKNHEQCKDKFYEKLVSIEQYLKQGTHVCDIK